MPSEADRQAGEAKGLTPGEIDAELEKFRDHTFGTARSDWSATFRNWLREAAIRLKRSSPNRSPSNPHHGPNDPRTARQQIARDARDANLARSLAAVDALVAHGAGH